MKKVSSPDQVRIVYEKALKFGASSEGEPGPRGDLGFSLITLETQTTINYVFVICNRVLYAIAIDQSNQIRVQYSVLYHLLKALSRSAHPIPRHHQ